MPREVQRVKWFVEAPNSMTLSLDLLAFTYQPSAVVANEVLFWKDMFGLQILFFLLFRMLYRSWRKQGPCLIPPVFHSGDLTPPL